MNIVVFFVILPSCLDFIRNINLSRSKFGSAETTFSAAALRRSRNPRSLQSNQYRFICSCRYGFGKAVSGNNRQIEDFVFVLSDKFLIACCEFILTISIKSDTTFGQPKLPCNALHIIIHSLRSADEHGIIGTFQHTFLNQFIGNESCFISLFLLVGKYVNDFDPTVGGLT